MSDIGDRVPRVRTVSTPIEERRTEVADAAEALREQMDVLLDRAAERILKTPAAGTASWHAMWQNRDSSEGQAHLRRHLLMRISVAGYLGLDTARDVRAALAAGATRKDVTAAAAAQKRSLPRRSRRARRCDGLQLQLFDG